jgi:hypothetical protein
VWSPHGSHLEEVEYDSEFWEETEDSLEQFYMHSLLPEIVDPRAPRGLPVREPEYILQVREYILWGYVHQVRTGSDLFVTNFLYFL